MSKTIQAEHKANQIKAIANKYLGQAITPAMEASMQMELNAVTAKADFPDGKTSFDDIKIATISTADCSTTISLDPTVWDTKTFEVGKQIQVGEYQGIVTAVDVAKDTITIDAPVQAPVATDFIQIDMVIPQSAGEPPKFSSPGVYIGESTTMPVMPKPTAGPWYTQGTGLFSAPEAIITEDTSVPYVKAFGAYGKDGLWVDGASVPKGKSISCSSWEALGVGIADLKGTLYSKHTGEPLFPDYPPADSAAAYANTGPKKVGRLTKIRRKD